MLPERKVKISAPNNADPDNPRLVILADGQRPDAWWWLVVVVIAITALMAIFLRDPYRNIFIFVMDGVAITVFVTIIAFLLTLIVGLFGGLGRLSKTPPIYGFTTLYVEIVRGIPLLVQLIWWYYAFPVLVQQLGRIIQVQSLVSYQANPVAMAVVGLVVCYGAFMSEIYRAGIQSIPIGQMEAALSLGMTRNQSLTYVILPQAIRVMLPPMGNEFIAILKDSSLVSAVAVADLTRRGREYMAAHFNPIEVWAMVALIYLIMTLFVGRVVTWIEAKTKITH